MDKSLKLALTRPLPVVALWLAACTGEQAPSTQAAGSNPISSAAEAAPAPRSTKAIYDPSVGAIPTPNDLLFYGSVDGTINITPALGGPLPVPEPLLSLSSVDGASTVAPILMNFSRAISGTSLVPGGSVRLFEVSTFVDPVTAPIGGPVTGVTNELTGADFTVAVLPEFGNAAIQIQPLAPLTASRVNPATGALENSVYMVVLTDAILDADGVSVTRDVTYALAAQPTPFAFSLCNSVSSSATLSLPFRAVSALSTKASTSASTSAFP